MKYIQVVNTVDEAILFKEQILLERQEEPHRYIIKVKNGNVISFMSTDWKFLPQKPIAIEYRKESEATKKFIDILYENHMFGDNYNYHDKNIYEEDINKLTSLGQLFNGNLQKELLKFTQPKYLITDLSCLSKFEGITDISGIAEKDKCQNLFGAINLQKVSIPKSVKNIGKSAFAFCDKLNTIELPNTIESIKSKAFFGCTNLKEIIIPENVKELESLIFANSGITKITLRCLELPKIMKTTFDKMNSNFNLYVPRHLYNKYSEQWPHLINHIFISEN